ncbi:MAG: hypothetical protein MK212_16200 [Saprospiraceae bacterium]|nr:hypothetical protein [Saprospiraceae bacterium]
MHKSKLVQILSVLDRKEKEAFRKWINSPIALQHDEARQLLIFLLGKKKITERTVQKENIFELLYPNTTYDDLRLRHTINIAYNSILNFVRFLELKKDHFINEKVLIRYLYEHNLKKKSQQQIQKTQKTLEKSSAQNGAYYYQQYQLEEIIFQVNSSGTRVEETNLQKLVNQHHIAFVIDSLRHACTALTHQRIYKKTYEIPMLSSILETCKHLIHIPAVQLYFYAYQTMQDANNTANFDQLKQLLLAYPNILTLNETKNIYLIAVNFCIKQFNSGVQEFNQELLDLMKYGLNKSILLDNGELSRFSYKNIVTAALRAKELDWTWSFIQTYTSKIPVAYQETYQAYALSRYYYENGDYDQCQTLLAQIEFDDVFLNMSTKLLLLKIYYEQSYTDLLDAHLQSFRRYLERKKIVSYAKTNYKNIIRFVELLGGVLHTEQDKISKLAEEIAKTNPLTERLWLQTQLQKI